MNTEVSVGGSTPMNEELANFVRDSLSAGREIDEISEVLRDAGWESAQVEMALSRYHLRPFPVPIPKPRPYASPRLAFLNLFHFVVAYVTVWNVVDLLFTFLDYYLPDGLGRMQGMFRSYSPISEAIRGNLATIICAVPLVFWTNKLIDIASTKRKQAIPRIRLVFIYLTLFIGGCVMLGSATCLVYYFLSGELGVRFLIKVAILGTLTLGSYLFYRVETKATEEQA